RPTLSGSSPFFFSSRRRHTRFSRDWSSDVCSSDLQRRENYAVLAPDRETFVALVTEGQSPAPGYFVHDANLNKQLRPLLDEDVADRKSVVEGKSVAVGARRTVEESMGGVTGGTVRG